MGFVLPGLKSPQGTGARNIRSDIGKEEAPPFGYVFPDKGSRYNADLY